MKTLIFSDVHLKKEIINKIIEHEQPDLIIALGDFTYDFNYSPSYIVKGNNDIVDYPDELVVNLDNHNIFMCHGHRYDVDFSEEELIKKAKQLNCDTIYYGHTHTPVDHIVEDIHIINPGSVSFPRYDKMIPTYVIYENQTYTFKHAKTFNEIPDLFEPVQKKSFFSFFKKKG